MRGVDYVFLSNNTYSTCTRIHTQGIHTRCSPYISSITEDRPGGREEEAAEIGRWGQRAEWWRYDMSDGWNKENIE